MVCQAGKTCALCASLLLLASQPAKAEQGDTGEASLRPEGSFVVALQGRFVVPGFLIFTPMGGLQLEYAPVDNVGVDLQATTFYHESTVTAGARVYLMDGTCSLYPYGRLGVTIFHGYTMRQSFGFTTSLSDATELAGSFELGLGLDVQAVNGFRFSLEGGFLGHFDGGAFVPKGVLTLGFGWRF